MARYRTSSVYLRNGQIWRKSGWAILDEMRRRAAEAREEQAKGAQQALADLRAEVEQAKVERESRRARKLG